jgi:hypothetical protein
MNNSDINTFLKFGYYLNYKNPCINFDYSNIDKTRYSSYSEYDLITEGSKILMSTISKRFSSHNTHVVPISGGLDSRVILAGLLENTEAKNIRTYTFGSPGTLDYDIGNFVAKELGTNHISFSLENQSYNTEDLIKFSDRFDNQTVLFHHPPINSLQEYYGDSLHWSGFMGGELAGAHLSDRTYTSIEDAFDGFIKKNTFVKSIDLNSPNYEANDIYKFLEYSKKFSDRLTMYENIDFNNRQLKYIAPHILLKGMNYSLPFLDEDWFNFILSVDNRYRENQYLYKKILLELFPHEFSLKTKTNHGASLDASKFRIFMTRVKSKIESVYSRRNVNINYVDFAREIRENYTLHQTVRENLHNLSERRLLEWIDIKRIFEEHINKNVNYADAILVLCSLEIHLKANE